jgi:hypothetical protein
MGALGLSTTTSLPSDCGPSGPSSRRQHQRETLCNCSGVRRLSSVVRRLGRRRIVAPSRLEWERTEVCNDVARALELLLEPCAPLALDPQRKTDRTERRPGSPLVPTVRRFWIGVGVPRIRATSSSTQMDQQRRQSQSQRTWTTVLPIIPAVQARGRVSLHDDPEPERDEGRGFEVAIAVVRQNSLLLKLHQSAQSTRSDLRAE